MNDDFGPYVEHHGGVNTFRQGQEVPHRFWVFDPRGRAVSDGFASIALCAHHIRGAA